MELLWFMTRSKLGHHLAGWIFTHMSAFIPVERLYETQTLLAFRHPKPAYRVHILLVPKKGIKSPLDVKDADRDFLIDVFKAVGTLVEAYSLSETGYRLILNGGAYQDFPQLHFHLISDG